MAIVATLVNPNGSFTLGSPDGNITFKEGNLSNTVTEDQKEYLATYIDDKNKCLFSFETVDDAPEVPADKKSGAVKKVVKNTEQE